MKKNSANRSIKFIFHLNVVLIHYITNRQQRLFSVRGKMFCLSALYSLYSLYIYTPYNQEQKITDHRRRVAILRTRLKTS